MKKFKSLWVGLSALLVTTAVFAGVRVYNASNVLLGTYSDVKCSTNMSCTISGGRLTMAASSASLALASDEAITNSVDDTVEVKSNDEATTFRVEGFEAKSAILELASDDGDDAADVYSLTVDTSDVLTLKNSSTSLMTHSSSGDVSFLGTTPYITIGDAGAEDAGIAFDGNAQDFNISLDDSTDDLVIGLGVAGGTTDAIRIDENQDVTFVQNVLGLGTDSLSGFLQKQVASTSVSITAAQCGSTFVSNSADVMVLPEASTVLGCRLTFVCGTADDFDVNPADGTDVIGITGALSPSAGDAIRCTDMGAGFVLEAVGANLWAVLSTNGTITDVN